MVYHEIENQPTLLLELGREGNALNEFSQDIPPSQGSYNMQTLQADWVRALGAMYKRGIRRINKKE